MIVFNYKKEPARTPGQFVYRPVAEIYLRSKTDLWIKFNPYIDSGADVTLIPLSLGKLLGLKADNKIERIRGIKGSIPVTYQRVEAGIIEYNLLIQIAWAQIEEVPPLLGRTNIFDFFNITFKQKAGIIIFDKAKV